MRRDTQQQMHMIRSHMPLQNLDIRLATDLPNQIPHVAAHVSPENRLAILRGEHEVIVQAINSMAGSTQFAHRRGSYRKPAKAFA